MRKKKTTFKSAGLEHGFRSGLEDAIAEQLQTLGVPVVYESKDSVIRYTVPETEHRYTPDFVLPNGIIIESKGLFSSGDRKKHLYVQKQHPDKDIRFVFSNSKTKINKGSPTSYAKWCVDHGFLYADKFIPKEWIDE